MTELLAILEDLGFATLLSVCCDGDAVDGPCRIYHGMIHTEMKTLYSAVTTATLSHAQRWVETATDARKINVGKKLLALFAEGEKLRKLEIDLNYIEGSLRKLTRKFKDDKEAPRAILVKEGPTFRTAINRYLEVGKRVVANVKCNNVDAAFNAACFCCDGERTLDQLQVQFKDCEFIEL